MQEFTDEFAALDAALEQISEQYAAPPPPTRKDDDAFDQLLYDDAPPPPPVPDFEEEPWEEEPPQKPDLSAFPKTSAKAAQGEPFATVRSLDIDAELAEYGNRAETTVRGLRSSATQQQPQQLRGSSQQAAAASRSKQAAPAAPWGEESLRFSSTAAAQARPATDATMRAAAAKAAEPRGILMPLHEEFDLNNPPDEEKEKFVLPVLDQKAPTVSLAISCVDGRVEQVTASTTWTVQQLLHMMGSRLALWQVSFFAFSESDVNANGPDRWLDPRNTLAQVSLFPV